MRLLDLPVGTFLDRVASEEATPAGGSVAGVTVACAAALVAMAARLSDMPEVEALASELQGKAAGLADADARAYTAVLAAYRTPRDPSSERRDPRIAAALSVATDVPLAIIDCARQVAELAARVVAVGNVRLREDAMTAALLAEAAARGAAAMVRANVELGHLNQDRVRQAELWCDALRISIGEIEDQPA